MNLFTRASPRDKKSNLYYITLIGLLCIGSYLLGIWRTSSVIPRAAFDYSSGPPCEKFSKTTSTRDLDFNTHHNPHDPPPVKAATVSFPSCGAKLSEHTPCEDAKRSLKFPRGRLEYRQRHCPEREEALKCRIPAPYGYKTPFRWPESRDVAWFANVPHTELTVEKKNQNWVRYENDRFWFPGGGTMFPRGADSYIDDIGQLIDLSHGSIRTAIDTVLCVAVASLIAIAVCCCLPCIIAVLYALAEREGASDEEIERLPRFKFLTVRNSEKVNGEILETHGGIMTQLGVDSPSERVLSSDEAECCVCLCEYEDGTELRELWCRHHFHEACIDKWLRINATCPLCKSNILKTDEQSGNDAV
ncbi:hypothetical protein F2Q69_00018102 [Brassica cretica]|uniref:Methyltransferase n=1 Tax=Brassica cretica TaxID=69181 RepID=A0A8S9R2S6_BRACR|nr:hypothetical protein F2Q69_00018102 [Brassica cretica]